MVNTLVTIFTSIYERNDGHSVRERNILSWRMPIFCGIPKKMHHSKCNLISFASLVRFGVSRCPAINLNFT